MIYAQTEYILRQIEKKKSNDYYSYVDKNPLFN